MGRVGRYVVLVAFLVVSCAGAAPNILHVQAGPSGVSSTQVEVNDSFLARQLAFGDVSVHPPAGGGVIEAQVFVRNEGVRDMAFEYRFLWYDTRGFELSSATSWLPATLAAKEARGYKSTAPGPDAAGFRFMVRKPRPLTATGS